MIEREFYEAVATGMMTDEMMAFAKAKLEKMAVADAKAAEKKAEKKAEDAPLYAALEAALTDEVQLTSDLAKAIEVSTSKASYLLRQMAAAGQAVSEDVAVKGGTRKGWKRA